MPQLLPVRLRFQLRIALLLFLLIFATIALTSLHLLDKGERAREIKSRTLLTYSLVKEMFTFELYALGATQPDSAFFLGGESPALVSHQQSRGAIGRILDLVMARNADGYFPINDSLLSIRENLAQHILIFEEAIALQRKIGYREWGLEGQMRKYAHLLEADPRMDQFQLLILRRNEKDYLLRNDTSYIEEFRQRAQKLQDNLPAEWQTASNLSAYQQAFFQLVEARKQMGTYETSGLKLRLMESASRIEGQLTIVASDVLKLEKSILESLKITYYLVLITAVLLGLLLTLVLPSMLASPLAQLAAKMQAITKSGNIEPVSIRVNPFHSKELHELVAAFNQLLDQLKEQIGQLEEQSALLEKSNNELRKLNQELDYFAYSTSHDLKAPLGSVKGLISLARLENNPEMTPHYLGMMMESIRKLELFIGEIEDVSRNARTEIRPENISITRMVKDIAEHQPIPSELKNRFNTSIRIEEEAAFCSDRRRIHMILNNLISNAYKYHDAQKEQIFVRISGKITAKGLTLSVQDNGIGIESGYLPKVFDMFYRATEKKTGTGLGLYIVREAAHKIGGEVTVISEAGVGSTFTLEVPNMPLPTPAPVVTPPSGLA